MSKCKCPECKQRAEDRKFWKVFIFVLFTAFLAGLLLSSCSDARKLSRIHKRSPELFKTVTKVDTIIQVDSFEIKANEITEKELDSLLVGYCDTLEIEKPHIIRKTIIERCKLVNMLPAKTIRHENDATVTVEPLKDGTLKITIQNFRIKEVRKESAVNEISDWQAIQQASGAILVLLLVSFLLGVFAITIIRNILR